MSFYEFTSIMERLGFGDCKAINDKDKKLFVCVTRDYEITGRESNNTIEKKERGNKKREFEMYDMTAEVALCR